MGNTINETWLDTLSNQIEAQIYYSVQVLQNLDESTLQRPSVTGGWSIAQCLWHLNSYGDYYLPLLEKGIAGAEKRQVIFKSGWMGLRFTNMMLPGKGRYKAFKNHVPPDKLDGYEVVADFVQQLETLLSLIRQAREVNLNKVKIPISIASFIRLKAGDVLMFIIAHNERHLEQARRNIH